MPARTPRTKGEKQAAVHEVMSEYKEGKLHSGSKKGPKVKSRKQAVAIAMSESGQSKKGSPPKQAEAKHEAREKEIMGAGYAQHHKDEGTKGHEYEQSMMHPKGFDHKQLKGCFLAEHHRAVDVTRTPHRFSGTRNSGPVLRVSGHKGAHQIGKR